MVVLSVSLIGLNSFINESIPTYNNTVKKEEKKKRKKSGWWVVVVAGASYK